MYASEDLRNEHEVILFGMVILEKMTEMIHEGKKLDTGDAADMVNFLRLFADKCHHGKEEGYLFPAMVEAGVPSDAGPIGQMLLEHNKGRGYIGEMDASIGREDIKEDKFIIAAQSYISLMRAHISKENNVLFQLGDKILSEEKQLQLLEQFERFEQEVMGKEVHDKLHALLRDLESKYLI